MIANDKFGRMVTYTRYAGALITEYREDGYYYAYPIHTSQGGNTGFVGPFPTRQAAKDAEAAKIAKRYRKRA